MKTVQTFFSRLSLTSFILALLYHAGFACNSAPPTPPPFTVTVCTSSTVEITFSGYTSFGSTAGENCACGLVLPSIISNVVSIEVIDLSTNMPLPQFSFSPNSNTTSGFNALSAANWSGFSSVTSADIPAGLNLEIRFIVTVTNCVTQALIDAVFDLPNAIGTGGADVNGVPDHHVNITNSGMGSGSFPVELKYFNGRFDDNVVKLFWETASEINNDYFLIEKSSNGIDFNELSKVAGKGNSSYSEQYTFVDESPIKGTTYYRLKQVDFDNTHTYSDLISVTANHLSLIPLKVFPVPSRDRTMLTFNSDDVKSVTLEIYDFQGNRMFSKVIQTNIGEQSIPISLLDYPPGIYLVSIRNLEENLLTTRISKI